MKIVKVSGGLGNQMFIYAFCVELRQRGYNTILLKNRKSESISYGSHGYEIEKLFNIKRTTGLRSVIFNLIFTNFSRITALFPENRKDRLYRFVNVDVVRVSYNFVFFPDVFSFREKNQLFLGTWQSEMYFKNSISIVKKTFEFNSDKVSDLTRTIARKINQVNSISLHIRGGDYLSEKFINGFSNICTDDYYRKAIEFIKGKVSNPFFYIFSDDYDFVSKNFRLNDYNFVTHNSGNDSWQDMYLMSQCKHNIIANSSFSWWGAWLNDNNSKIVIAPKKWWNSIDKDDIVPKDWIRI